MTNKITVCVTGASGFIAAHVINQLLEKGYTVRGTVRGDSQHYPYLNDLPGAKDRLTLIKADLLKEGSFDKAVQGCDFVIHTASPYIVNVKNPQTDLVDPAVKGTTNVLNACKKDNGIKRVILTSSVAAITDEPDSNKVFTESDWNTLSSLKRNPYFFSKVEAEKAAWAFVETNKTSFDLIAINPFMVIGPSLTPGLNESNKIFKDILTGAYPTIMSVTWGIVDVRDVASAHILAMETESAKGRYLVSNEVMKMTEVIDFLKNSGFEKYKLPKLNLANNTGNFIMKLLSYTQPKGSGTYMRSHIGREMRYDNNKVKNDLGIAFIPAKESIVEAINGLVKWNHLKAKH